MTPIKRNILYIFLRTLLRVRITWNHGTSITVSTGYHVDRKDEKGKIKWDGSRCVRNTFHGKDKIPAAVINKVLENLESKIDAAFYSFEASDKMPTPQELKDVLSNKKEDNGYDLWVAFSEFVREGSSKKNWADNTIRSVNNLRPILKAFNPDLTFEDINEKTLDNFIQFQTKHKLSHKYADKEKYKRLKSKIEEHDTENGYTNSVILKNCRMLKWFLRWAANKGYVDRSAERNFKPELKENDKPVIFLNWEELTRLETMELQKGSQWDMIRDFFCFCCFTSLRFSDAYNLKKVDVKENHIELVSQKTSTRLVIDLNGHSKKILDKYKEADSDFALPHIPNDIQNYHLKAIAKMAGIDEPVKITNFYGNQRKDIVKPKYEFITTHCGRRTFICNALSMGISPIVVMKWTGHSDYSAMKPYIDIIDNTRSEAMKLFNK
ncbi:MAG: integrase catalytic domain-containing protein [Muribaculaceae bacterium]|nr:integrase catalytic domain-containing protein [Muribaculaceae bacterium]